MAKAVTLKNSNDEEVYPVTDISLVNGELPTARIADDAITTDKVADEAITSDKIDWSTMYAKIVYAGSIFTTSSTTMADKITITGVPKGRYVIRANTNWYNSDGGANGECNMRLVKVDGGTTTNSDYSTVLIPAVSWVGIQNVMEVIWTVNNDNTTVKIQTSVNWPARGTYWCRATSYLLLIRVGELG